MHAEEKYTGKENVTVNKMQKRKQQTEKVQLLRETFGTNIRSLREEAGITQKKLAASIGASKTSISLYESFQRMPSPDTLVSLARVFHKSTDSLLGRNDKRWIDVSGLKDEHIRCLEGLAKALKRDRKRRGYSAAGKSRTLNKR